MAGNDLDRNDYLCIPEWMSDQFVIGIDDRADIWTDGARYPMPKKKVLNEALDFTFASAVLE